MAAILERTAEITDDLDLPMPQRPLGKFGWNASVLTLGGVKWDTMRPDDEAIALIHRALELGINTFDTAFIYGKGESERKLGLALEGIRRKVWVETKVIDRTYDGAKEQMETSLTRLKTDYVDLMFVHSVDDEEQYRQIMGPNSVIKAIEEFRAAGHIRHIGVSGHWVKDVQARIIQEYPFEAVLCPVGIINLAYDYSFVDSVLPIARERGMAVLAMKILGAGRAKNARSVEPYFRYTLGQDIDTAVVGVDSIAQLEENVRIAKRAQRAPTDSEIAAILSEAREITQEWDEGEFDYVKGYMNQ